MNSWYQAWPSAILVESIISRGRRDASVIHGAQREIAAAGSRLSDYSKNQPSPGKGGPAGEITHDHHASIWLPGYLLIFASDAQASPFTGKAVSLLAPI